MWRHLEDSVDDAIKKTAEELYGTHYKQKVNAVALKLTILIELGLLLLVMLLILYYLMM